MAISEVQGSKVPVRLWTPIEEVEAQAVTQLQLVASTPWVFHHVAAMADVHVGIGATVGSVIAMKNAVMPAAVGVDIGCGMGAIKTNLKASDLPDNLDAVRSEIERLIPVGFDSHEHWPSELIRDSALVNDYMALFDEYSTLEDGVQSGNTRTKAALQCGTLGNGNHFIELCLDTGSCIECGGPGDCHQSGMTDPNVWMMLHSGSRGIGNQLAQIHMARAKKLAHNAELPDPDLSVFLSGTPEMDAYRRDLYWAQRYALINRRVMFALYEVALRKFFPQLQCGAPTLCHHNYVAEEQHFGEDVFVTRKGAIRAGSGEMGIIPGSMGTKSYIVRGLGNPDSFSSASHGAGRRMSRGAARRKFTQADLEAQTAGVCCRKDIGVVDEIPAAYKNIDAVMTNQKDLVEVVAELKQVLCCKG